MLKKLTSLFLALLLANAGVPTAQAREYPDLALDCRAEGRRNAVVSLEIVSGDRVSKGDATEPTADGNYSASFSRAFSKAYAHAIEGLKAEK